MPQLDKFTYFTQFFWSCLFLFTFYIPICNDGDGFLGISRILKLRNRLVSQRGNNTRSNDPNSLEEILRKGFSTGVSYMYSSLFEVAKWCNVVDLLGKGNKMRWDYSSLFEVAKWCNAIFRRFIFLSFLAKGLCALFSTFFCLLLSPEWSGWELIPAAVHPLLYLSIGPGLGPDAPPAPVPAVIPDLNGAPPPLIPDLNAPDQAGLAEEIEATWAALRDTQEALERQEAELSAFEAQLNHERQQSAKMEREFRALTARIEWQEERQALLLQQLAQASGGALSESP
ncbi:putative H(+)-transporting two-sector ATPase (mitochondrion) [Rosa chinensis]|uniref:H(+)-transporting two-sector ATPase n=1 Tax=Rosa chinensis TaxID=74649 RepID=A0A2P6P159_ROSCH|nr:putative H(+)-transporting two-sector ATPase [Rosa chinensis]